jgi:gamma-glutamyl hydrolase
MESAGAQVVPIPYDADKATIDMIFENINGVLFPGGSTAIEIDSPQPGS